MKTSKEIADWILGKVNIEAGDTISPLKLQKLIYYCQAWHFTVFDEPLFDEKVEAWAHGPVIPSQYYRFSFMFRTDNIPVQKINLETPEFSDDQLQLLNEVLDIYGEHSASYLENLTHIETPWINARNGCEDWERSNEEITLDSMKKYYSTFLKNEQAQ